MDNGSPMGAVAPSQSQIQVQGQGLSSCILPVYDFQLEHPEGMPFLGVCAGPYHVSFRLCECAHCGSQALVREYSAKIVALNGFPVVGPTDEQRSAVGQMDSIGLANYVMHAHSWVCGHRPGEQVGLSILHSPVPKWALESTSRIIEKLRNTQNTGFSRISYKASAVGRKRMVSLCPACNSELPAFRSCLQANPRMRHMLLGTDGEPLLYIWPVVASSLTPEPSTETVVPELRGS